MMRPTAVGLVAAAAGISISAIMVLSILGTPLTPLVILRGGSSETVPGWTNTSGEYANTPALCSGHSCGYAGEFDLTFSVTDRISLTGMINSAAPIWLALASPSGAFCGYFAYPEPPCPVPIGPVHVFVSPEAESSFDLAALDFNFTGQNNDLPAGQWSIIFANVNPSPVEVTVAVSIVVAPA